VIVLTSGLGAPVPAPWVILIFNGFFVALFVGSALLFRQAVREQGGISDRPGSDDF
jgi:hypothetical protein